MEIWKDIENFEGYYQVSSEGRIRSLDRYVPHGIGGVMRIVRSRILKHTKAKPPNSYSQVNLNKNGVSYQKSVHTLVAKAFIDKPNTEEILVVRHGINGISDNSVNNLSWGTHQDNSDDQIRDNTVVNTHKYKCPLDHKYERKNLRIEHIGSRKPARKCVSCDRARSYIKIHPEYEFKFIADLYYQEILTGKQLVPRRIRKNP